MRWLILCTIAIAPVWLPAEVYKWADPQGNVIYSDKPHPGAEEIKLPETQAYPAPQTASPTIKPEQQSFPGYEKIEIATPANDETIRDNTGNINVSIKLEPELQVDLGHKLVLYVDGVKLPQELTSTLFQFTNLDRGTHTIHAAVVDSAGKELVSSKPSTFHLKRFSSLLSPPANQGSSKKR